MSIKLENNTNTMRIRRAAAYRRVMANTVDVINEIDADLAGWDDADETERAAITKRMAERLRDLVMVIGEVG